MSSARINYLGQHARRAAEFMRLPDGYQQFFAATQISSRHVRRQLYAPGFWDRVEGEGGYARLEAEYFPAGGRQPGTAQGEHGPGHQRRTQRGEQQRDHPGPDPLVEGQHPPKDRDDRVGQGQSGLSRDQPPSAALISGATICMPGSSAL